MPPFGGIWKFIMKKKLYIIPLFLSLFSFVVIYLSLQLDTSPEMIVGDSMQARSFPIFLMVINLVLVCILSFQFYKTYPKEIELEKFPTWSSMLLFLVFYILNISLNLSKRYFFKYSIGLKKHGKQCKNTLKSLPKPPQIHGKTIGKR